MWNIHVHSYTLQKLTPLKRCGTLVEDLISPCGDERFNSSYIQPIN